MAIWQYKLEVILKNSVLKRFGFIPAKLEINHEGWENFRQKRLQGIKDEPDFEDAYTINWWKDIPFNRKKIVSSINSLIKQCEWSNSETISWKGDTRQKQDHDVYIHFDEWENIVEFYFRTDLRDDSLDFLAEMLEICKENEWLVMDAKGYLMNPGLLDVYDSVRNSNTTKFLEDPERFFENLISGALKPE